MTRPTIRPALVIGLAALLSTAALADTTPQTLPFNQNWSNTALITTNNDWSGVPGIVGKRGDLLAPTLATDPQTITAADDPGVISVLANQTNPNTNTTGAVAEFDTLVNTTVAFQGSGTAQAPYLLITLNTTNFMNVNVAYNLRDVDGSTDSSIQPVALLFRVGTSGTFTNVPAGFVADASAGPSLSGMTTAVSAQLPAAADNQAVVQVRIVTTNAVGSDEWIGVDDINITGLPVGGNQPVVPSCPASANVLTGSNGTVPISATDVDGTVTGATITGITPTDPGTITISGLVPAGGVGGTATANIAVSNATPNGTYAVTVQWSNSDAMPQTASCVVNITVANQPIVPSCPTGAVVVPQGTNNVAIPVSATDADGTVTGASITGITPADPGTITLTSFTAAGAAGGTATAKLSVSNATPVNNYSVTITWTNNDMTPQTAPCAVTLNVVGGGVAIHTIQGSGSASPMTGMTILTTGIVTARRSNGIHIQVPDADVDADPNTSEAVFVFTSSAPPASAVLGTLVSASGQVQEFIPSQDPYSTPITEIGNVTNVSVLSAGNPLPAPVTITAADTLVNDVDTLEKYEAMRVFVPSLTVIAPTGGTRTESSATSTSNGTFYTVVTGVPRPFREPGIEVGDPLPSGSSVTLCPTGSPNCVPVWDFNPERIRVNTVVQTGGTALDVSTGATLTNTTGVLDFAFRTYTILTDPSSPPVVAGGMTGTAVTTPIPEEFTVATVNMERFYDDVDDAGGDVVLTTTAYNNRKNKESLVVRDYLKTPDIIGVEEMENLTVLQSLASKINADAVAAAQPNPLYTAYLSEGNDVGLIDVGFLVKTATVVGATPRITVNAVVQEGAAVTFTNPDTSTSILHDRPPLRLDAVVNYASGASFPITVIVVHNRSLGSVDSELPGTNGWVTEGARVRFKRRAQAEWIATNLVQARQTMNPNERIVIVGDYNAFEVNDGYGDSIGTIMGTPTPASQVVLASVDLVTTDLVNLHTTPPPAERYSYTFDGDAQSLDHILVNQALVNGTGQRRMEHARVDADFPETARNNPNTPLRNSDHDPALAYFCPTLTSISAMVTGSTSLCPTTDGGTASATDVGGANSAYQWGYRTVSGGAITDISGATASMYVLHGPDFPAMGGTYYLVQRATGPAPCGGTVVSNEIAVTMDMVAPTVMAPADVTVTQTLCQ
ncbi:MAG TPA: hypothetical protein VGR00_11930 [Thermoanaerobaculia bacterium]|nr:hypothetical protein [Thermoanaerobaculia bacterium]